MTPKALAERPEIADHVRFEWRAFWLLLRDRPPGPAGQISFTAIDRFAVRYGIDDVDAFERFTTLIGSMEQTLAEHLQQRQKVE